LLLLVPLLGGSPPVAPASAQESAPPAVVQILDAPLADETSDTSDLAAPSMAASPNVLAAAPITPTLPPSPVPTQPLLRTGYFARAVSELDTWVTKTGGKLGVTILDAATGTDLGSSAADVPVNPASNQKIVTAAAALRYFGAGHRFKAGLYGRVDNNVVPELVLRSDGDPSLDHRDLQQMVAKIKAIGVTRVLQIRVDQSAFDNRYVPPAFEQQPNEWAAFRAPVSAVSLDRNATTLHVTPGTAGNPANVWFEPQGFVDITGSVRTDPRGKAQSVRLTLRPQGSKLTAVVAGGIGPTAQEFRWSRRVDDPSLYAGLVLKHMLSTSGISVDGDVTLGGEKEKRELVSRESVPLGMLLTELGKNSDNFYAETLLKAIGARFRRSTGTSEAGAAALIEFLSEIGALESGTQIGNGSGLYSANKLSPRSLARVLSYAFREPTLHTSFVEHLAIGGVDGTLRMRFAPFRKQGVIRAKTGTLNSVIALSGYVFTPDQERAIAFSIIVTDLAGHHGQVRQRTDALVTKIAKRLQD
jgi:D-alanyl-D-alanine carboxypeptidase/D-alanyl-D-alanine-endopeptidase (penicillin-binding protein 4)